MILERQHNDTLYRDVHAPDLTIGARKTPSLKSWGVRCSSLGLFDNLGDWVGDVERGRRDIPG